MTAIFSALLSDLINSAFTAFDEVMIWLLDGMLHVEHLADSAVSSIITDGVITELYQFVYTLAWGLLILKFLFKGFEIYILWRDGDADASPQDMLIGSVEAVAVMLVFPFLYDVMAEVTVWFATGLMDRMGLSTWASFPLKNLEELTGLGIIFLLLMLVYLILLVVLIVKLIQRGFELLVMRLGVPISCLGLIDSDKGLFKGYIQTFYKAMFTSVIQIVLMSFSLRVIVTPSLLNLLCGIAVITTAFATPMMMQQLLVSVGHGGGMSQKIYSVSMAANAIRGLAGK